MSAYLDIDYIVDYKTFLQEVLQKHGSSLPDYDCYKTTGPEHNKVFHFKVTVTLFDQEYVVYDRLSVNSASLKRSINVKRFNPFINLNYISDSNNNKYKKLYHEYVKKLISIKFSLFKKLISFNNIFFVFIDNKGTSKLDEISEKFDPPI